MLNFRHFRFREADGRAMNTGGYTLVTYDGITLYDEPAVMGALVRCSEKDNFSRELGREYAMTKLLRQIKVGGQVVTAPDFLYASPYYRDVALAIEIANKTMTRKHAREFLKLVLEE